MDAWVMVHPGSKKVHYPRAPSNSALGHSSCCVKRAPLPNVHKASDGFKFFAIVLGSLFVLKCDLYRFRQKFITLLLDSVPWPRASSHTLGIEFLSDLVGTETGRKVDLFC